MWNLEKEECINLQRIHFIKSVYFSLVNFPINNARILIIVLGILTSKFFVWKMFLENRGLRLTTHVRTWSRVPSHNTCHISLTGHFLQ